LEKLFDTFILKAGAGDFHMVFIGKQHFHCLWSMLNFPITKKGLRKLRPSLFRLLFREKASEYFCGPFYNLTADV